MRILAKRKRYREIISRFIVQIVGESQLKVKIVAALESREAVQSEQQSKVSAWITLKIHQFTPITRVETHLMVNKPMCLIRVSQKDKIGF